MNSLIKSVYAFVLGITVCATVLANEILTPEQYFQIELESRQKTNDGMRARLGLLNSLLIESSSDVGLQDQYEINEQNRNDVSLVFVARLVTPGQHAAFGTRNREMLNAYLQDRPELLSAFEALDAEFNELIEALDPGLDNQQGDQ